MKKFIILTLMFLVFAIGLPLTADANTCQCRRYRHRSYAHRTVYRSRSYGTGAYVARRPSFYHRHRNMINMGIGAGAGALVGGLIGGRRGVGYGLLAGTGAGALYTYKLHPKRRRY